MPQFNPDSYVDVQTRITRFWSEYPEGAIRTEHRSDPNDFERTRYLASVYKHRDNPLPDATGWAFELAGGRGPQSTSHEEVCETSAIGRALANMGYATSNKDRPSREEMSKVHHASPVEDDHDASVEHAAPRVMNGRPPTDKQLWLFRKLLEETGYPPAQLRQDLGWPAGIRTEDLSGKQVSDGIEFLKGLPK